MRHLNILTSNVRIEKNRRRDASRRGRAGRRASGRAVWKRKRETRTTPPPSPFASYHTRAPRIAAVRPAVSFAAQSRSRLSPRFHLVSLASVSFSRPRTKPPSLARSTFRSPRRGTAPFRPQWTPECPDEGVLDPEDPRQGKRHDATIFFHPLVFTDDRWTRNRLSEFLSRNARTMDDSFGCARIAIERYRWQKEPKELSRRISLVSRRFLHYINAPEIIWILRRLARSNLLNKSFFFHVGYLGAIFLDHSRAYSFSILFSASVFCIFRQSRRTCLSFRLTCKK